MKLQSFFCLEFFQMLAEHEFSHLSPHLSEWNESKLPMFIKLYTMRCDFYFLDFLEKLI